MALPCCPPTPRYTQAALQDAMRMNKELNASVASQQEQLEELERVSAEMSAEYNRRSLSPLATLCARLCGGGQNPLPFEERDVVCSITPDLQKSNAIQPWMCIGG